MQIQVVAYFLVITTLLGIYIGWLLPVRSVFDKTDEEIVEEYVTKRSATINCPAIITKKEYTQEELEELEEEYGITLFQPIESED